MVARAPLRSRAAAGGAVLALAVTGCGSSTPTTSTSPPTDGRPVATVGDLEIIDPFLPAPASPSVAAVYLTVRDTGSTPDELISVTTPAASTSMLMTEDAHGSVDTMTRLADLAIPAHGQASLSPGRDHAMLEGLRGSFKVGQTVDVTLRFKRAGTVRVEVPVVTYASIVNGADGSGSMSGMAGM